MRLGTLAQDGDAFLVHVHVLPADSPRLPDGSCRLPRRLADPAVAVLLAVQDRLSAKLWDAIDLYPGRFEAFAARLQA